MDSNAINNEIVNRSLFKNDEKRKTTTKSL